MNCPNCDQQNAVDAKFCSKCGTSLTITCSVCGTVASVGDSFCSNCGSALHADVTSTTPPEDLSRYLPAELLAKMRSAREGRAMQGERRTVTMLFADVTGSTAAAERFDPEDWSEIMNGAFEHLISPIYRYEGTLAQLRGDAVLAFFGAPIAHEDDPVRALRAGLEMLEAVSGYSAEVETQWGIPLQIRVGVNTGLVVVGEVGSDLRVEYTALGDAINVAARMEQTAEPGTVQVSDETLSRTRGMFATEELGPVDVKGKSEPVVAHRVHRYVGGVDETDRLPILGREVELERLDSLVSSVAAGSGWISTVIADAGIGKTRLLQEWKDHSSAALDVGYTFDASGQVSWLSASSRSYDANDPQSTIRELLTRYWGSAGQTPSFELVESAAAAAGLNDTYLSAVLGYLAGASLSEEAEAYVGALETPALNGKARETFLSYIAALAAQRPVVLVFEDLHWADDVSLALVEQIMDLTETSAVGMLASMRPYRDEPTWRIHEVAERNHHHRYHPIELAPLPNEQGGMLLDSLADTAQLSKDEKSRILERSDGNPLFIEEIAKSLGEAESGSTLPSSLAGTLTARLDRLDDASKYLVQVASVLGVEFDRETLEVVLDRDSTNLQLIDLFRRGILVESSDKPGSLQFRHALFQEAAYETILRRTRRELHRKVGDYLVASHPERALDISTHLVEANEAERAFPYLVEAGLRASRSMSLAESIRLLTEALDHVPESPDQELIVKAHESLGEAYSMVPDLSQASAAYQRLLEFGRDHERPTARVSALNRLGWTAATLGADLEGAMGYLEDARTLAEECGDDVGLAEYHMTACFIASMGGQVADALEHDERTVELGEKSGVDYIRLSGIVRRATNYIALLDFENGMPAVEQGLEETREAGQEEGHAIIEGFGVGLERLVRGELHQSLEIMERTNKTLERYSSFYRGMNLRDMGAVLYEMGDLEGALARYVDCRRVADRQGQPFVAVGGATGSALIYAELGMSDPIPELREVAEASFGRPMSDFLASTIWADLGTVSLFEADYERAAESFATGLQVSSTTQYIERPRLLCGQALTAIGLHDIDKAVTALDEAQRIIDDKRLEVYRAHVGHARGLTFLEQGDLEASAVALLEAQQKAMTFGQVLQSMKILKTRAEVAAQIGNTDEATLFRQQAGEAVASMSESIVDETLKRSFLTKETQPDGRRDLLST
ncbi:MAG: adenylate/guanylate cyclase domain-containing protein [Acidimicrobiia bacterium]